MRITRIKDELREGVLCGQWSFATSVPLAHWQWSGASAAFVIGYRSGVIAWILQFIFTARDIIFWFEMDDILARWRFVRCKGVQRGACQYVILQWFKSWTV